MSYYDAMASRCNIIIVDFGIFNTMTYHRLCIASTVVCYLFKQWLYLSAHIYGVYEFISLKCSFNYDQHGTAGLLTASANIHV